MRTNIEETQTINYMLFEKSGWNFYIAATEKGLCFVGSDGGTYEDMRLWLAKRFNFMAFTENKKEMYVFSHQLDDYLSGRTYSFNFPLDFSGTLFQETVWSILRTIPYGEQRSYEEIAIQAGHPKAYRAVGSAVGKNPLLIVIPCHRVLKKNGTHSGYRGSLDMKQRLLHLENRKRI